MAQQVFRPSRKVVRVAYFLTLIVIAAAIWACLTFIEGEERQWVAVLPLLLLVFPIKMHIPLLSVKMTLDGDHLVMETGILSKSTRTLGLAKVQDVTVRQGIMERMWSVGDITVETAGETSALTANNFDDPKGIAAVILRAAHKDSQTKGPGV